MRSILTEIRTNRWAVKLNTVVTPEPLKAQDDNVKQKPKKTKKQAHAVTFYVFDFYHSLLTTGMKDRYWYISINRYILKIMT